MRATVVLTVIFAACSSSSPTANGGGRDMQQSTTDGGGGSGGGGGAVGQPDMAKGSSGGFCGGQTCGPGTTCCITSMSTTPTCSASCPDGGLTAQCQKPSDCPSSAAACCITISNYMPQSVMCEALTACVPNVMANGTGLDRACVTDDDCTDKKPDGSNNGTTLAQCCTSLATSQHVCFSSSLLQLVPSLQQQFSCP